MWIQAAREYILPFAWSIGLISLPMFYHFELSGVNEEPFVGQWGLQDCLVASMAALATIVTVIGARNRLVLVSILGWTGAAYCLFIKPAGLLVMVAVGGIWLIEVAISAVRAGRGSFHLWWLEARRYVLITLLFGSGIFGFAIMSAFLSEYLSQANLQTARTAQNLLVSLSALTEVIPKIASYVRPVLGWWWFLVFGTSFIIALAAGLRSLVKKRFEPSLLRFSGAMIIILAAAYWWIFMAGIQARYYYPFILIVIIWLLPDVMQYLQRCPLHWRICLAAPAFLTTCILVALLWGAWRAPQLERLLGVNLSSGGFAEEVQLGRQLIDESRLARRSLQVYANSSIRTGVVFSLAYLDSIASGKPLPLNFTFAFDWARAPGVRLEEILRSDYLFFEENNGPTSPAKIDTFDQEISAYHGWLESLNVQNGVIRVKTGPLNVLRVQNGQRLRDAFQQFVAQHQWREVFIQNNAEVFPKN